MKKHYYFVLIVMLNMLFIYSVKAQNEITCKVLKTEISTSYTGECKKGYAHGKGIAKGVDEYDGNFRKGLPHGVGIYKWRNGDLYEGNFKNGLPSGYGKYIWVNGDIYEGNWLLGVKNGNGKFVNTGSGEIQIGKWYKDKFVGESQENELTYKITNMKNIRNFRISQKPASPFDNIEIIFKREGRVYHDMDNLTLIGSSGTIINSLSHTAFESIITPFNGKITFTAPDNLYRTFYQCEFTFEIKNQGSWLIEIFF